MNDHLMKNVKQWVHLQRLLHKGAMTVMEIYQTVLNLPLANIAKPTAVLHYSPE